MAGLSTLHIIFVSVTGLTMIASVICNMATLAAFVKLENLRQKTSSLLILSLSCADFGVGLVHASQFPLAVQRWPFGKLGCQVSHWLGSVCVSAGLLTTAAISIDRYLLISLEYPKYLSIQTKKRIMCTIGGIWLYGMVLGTTEVVLWDAIMPARLQDYFDYSRDCRSPPKRNPVFALLQFTFSLLCPVFIVEFFSLAFFVRLIRKLRHQSIHPGNDNPVIMDNSSCGSVPLQVQRELPVPRQLQSDPNKRYKKSAKVLGAIVTVMNICTLPFVIYAIVTVFCIECQYYYVRQPLVYLLYLNSSINPFLYAATMSAIRKFYKRILCKTP